MSQTAIGLTLQKSVKIYDPRQFKIPKPLLRQLSEAGVTELIWGLIPFSPACLLCVPEFWPTWIESLKIQSPPLIHYSEADRYMEPVSEPIKPYGKITIPKIVMEYIKGKEGEDERLICIGKDYFIKMYKDVHAENN